MMTLFIFFAVLIILVGLVDWALKEDQTTEAVLVAPVSRYITFMLTDLKKQGYTYPHVVIYSDLSGRVYSGLRIGQLKNRLFSFDDVKGIATDYIQWQMREDER